MNKYTNTVFASDAICKTKRGDYHMITAKKTIPCNTLLLLEHVFTGDFDQCLLLIRDNQYLYDTMHPRVTSGNDTNEQTETADQNAPTKKWKTESEENKQTYALVKTTRNCIGAKLDNIFFGEYMSKFNHACLPNSVFFCAVSRNHHGTRHNYIAVYSTSNIAEGDEITINYGPNRGHDESDDFVCECGQSDVKRSQICNVIYKIIVDHAKQKKEMFEKMVEKYEKSAKCKEVMIYQYLAKQGMIHSNDDICSVTPALVKNLNAIYNEGTLEDKKEKFVEHINDLFGYDG